MLRLRLAAQSVIKQTARSMGLELRYAFQNPSIFDPRVYARWFSPHQVKCVFDVGANIGQSAAAFARAFPNATVHSFEPFPAPFARLAALAGRWGDRVKPHQLACGDRDGTVNLAIDPNSCSALNQVTGPSAEPAANPADTTPIPIVRIDTFCAQNDVASIDLLKTDTEGFDAQVLAGAERMLSGGHVRCVVTEVGFIDDAQHTEFSSAFLLLHRFGFEIAGIYEVAYHATLACDFANVIFVRRK
jgi:FkbM family methyltransferase